MTVIADRVSLKADGNNLKLDIGDGLHNSVNIANTTELHTLRL